MSTYMPKAADIDRKWYIIDAEGQSLGRVAAKAATILRGKHKPTYAPHADCGDHAVEGMLPNNTLGRAAAKRLRVYKGAEHNNAAQKPVKCEL